MYDLLRPLLFSFEPETAHRIALSALQVSNALQLTRNILPQEKFPVKLFGLTFPNRIGLAAGLDKNGDYLAGLSGLGFGFIEIGTVTPLPQAGNPKPRLFRLCDNEALINRMGFNNKGLDVLVENVKRVKPTGILGISIGKNAATPDDRTVEDYLIGLEAVYPFADYVAINISSPNTAGLRKLQDWDALPKLLEPLKKKQAELAKSIGKHVPLCVKVAPDLSSEELEAIGQIFLDMEIDGIIATNTTLSRSGVEKSLFAGQKGGLSGAPLTRRSNEVVRTLFSVVQKRIPIIGSGGVMSGPDAAALIDAGASLVQLYTGLIYHGPSLIAQAAKAAHQASLRVDCP